MMGGREENMYAQRNSHFERIKGQKGRVMRLDRVITLREKEIGSL